MSTDKGTSASIITKIFHLTINFHVQRENENLSSILSFFYTTNTMTVQQEEELCGEGGVVYC